MIHCLYTEALQLQPLQRPNNSFAQPMHKLIVPLNQMQTEHVYTSHVGISQSR